MRNLNHWPWWIAIFHYLLNASVDLKNGWSDYLFFLVAVTTFVKHFNVFVHENACTHCHIQAKAIQTHRIQHTYKIYTLFVGFSLFCSLLFFSLLVSFFRCVGWFCSIDSLSNVGAFVNVYMFLRLPYSAFSFVIWSATNRFVTLLSIIE